VPKLLARALSISRSVQARTPSATRIIFCAGNKGWWFRFAAPQNLEFADRLFIGRYNDGAGRVTQLNRKRRLDEMAGRRPLALTLKSSRHFPDAVAFQN
jgi:hypothetical protein